MKLIPYLKHCAEDRDSRLWLKRVTSGQEKKLPKTAYRSSAQRRVTKRASDLLLARTFGTFA